MRILIHVTKYPEFGLDIKLYPVVVSVQVVRGNVGQHAHLETGLIQAVQLKGADLQHINQRPLVLGTVQVHGHGGGKTAAHIAGDRHPQTGLLQQMIGQQRGGGFAVGTGNAHQPGRGVGRRKFYFVHHPEAGLFGLLYPGQLRGNTRAFDDQIRSKQRCRSLAFFPEGYLHGLQCSHPFGGQTTLVPKFHLHAQANSEGSRPAAAFATPQNQKPGTFHRSLSRVKVMRTKSTVTIQNRVTILGSASPPSSK